VKRHFSKWKKVKRSLLGYTMFNRFVSNLKIAWNNKVVVILVVIQYSKKEIPS